MAAAGVPTAASRTFHRSRAGARVRRPARGAAGGEGLGPRRRQGRRSCAPRARTRPPQPCARCWASGAFGEAGRDGGDRGVSRGRGDLGPGASPTAATSSCCPRPRTTSVCSRATPDPNTGGMGAYSPVSIATPALLERARREVLSPTLDGDAPARDARSAACSTPASWSTPTARPGSSSSTAGSAIPRRRWCCRSWRRPHGLRSERVARGEAPAPIARRSGQASP